MQLQRRVNDLEAELTDARAKVASMREAGQALFEEKQIYQQ